ncbi:IS66 family transposase [soil metagenome]
MGTGVSDEAVGLRERVAWLETVVRLQGYQLDIDRAECDRLRGRVARLEADNARLRARNEALARAAKRQAAPFSRRPGGAQTGTSEREHRRSGRRPGAGYGRKAHRRRPEHVDRVVQVGLPEACPCCGDADLDVVRVAEQFQTDLPPVRPFVTRFDITIGRCRGCRARVQPRHREQTSDALGAAGSQLGPRAVAVMVLLVKQLGASAGRVATLFGQLGVEVTAGGVTGAVARAGRRCEATYDALIAAIRGSPTVAADETGWRVAGAKAWLWVFANAEATVYRIAAGRGYDVAAGVLGDRYSGVIERDGWAPYRRFTDATHQTCIAHLLRRCRELLADAHAGQARIPHAVRRLLLAALSLRDDRTAGRLDAATDAGRRAQLDADLDRLLARRPTFPPNRRLLDHLRRERDALLTFLDIGGVQATNWRAEQALRPAIVNRKTWGGNRTRRGADTQQILSSVLATVAKQHHDPVDVLIDLQQQPHPTVADLAVPGHTSPAAAITNTAAA